MSEGIEILRMFVFWMALLGKLEIGVETSRMCC